MPNAPTTERRRLRSHLGGTHQDRFSKGSLLTAVEPNRWSTLGIGTAGQLLHVNSAGDLAEWTSAIAIPLTFSDVTVRNELWIRKDVDATGTGHLYFGDDADPDMWEWKHIAEGFKRLDLYDNRAGAKKDILKIWQGEVQSIFVPGVTIPEDDGSKGMFHFERLARFDAGLVTLTIGTGSLGGTITTLAGVINHYSNLVASGVVVRYRLVRNNTSAQGTVLTAYGGSDNTEEWLVGMGASGSRNFKIIDNTDGGNTTVIDFGDALIGGTPIIGFNRQVDFTQPVTFDILSIEELRLGLATVGGSPVVTDQDKIRLMGSEGATVGNTTTSYQIIQFESPDFGSGSGRTLMLLNRNSHAAPLGNEGHDIYFGSIGAGADFFGIYSQEASTIETTTIQVNAAMGWLWDAGSAGAIGWLIAQEASTAHFIIGETDLLVVKGGIGPWAKTALVVGPTAPTTDLAPAGTLLVTGRTDNGTAPQIRLYESDQTLPVGMWRWSLTGGLLSLEENLDASGDFTTSEEWIRIQPEPDGDSKVRLWFINDLLGDKAVVFGDGTADPNKTGSEQWRVAGAAGKAGILVDHPRASATSVTIAYQNRNNNAGDGNTIGMVFSTRVASQVTANVSGVNAAAIYCQFSNRVDDDPGPNHTIRGSLNFTTANDETSALTLATHTRLVLRYDGVLHPFVDGTYDLGLTAERWRFLYVDDVSVTGDVAAATLAITGVTTLNTVGYTWSAADGSASQFLQTDGAGTLSWATALTSFTETNDLSAAVTWANVPDTNITASSVTQHEAALTILETQITDGSLLARVGGAETITGAWAFTLDTTITDDKKLVASGDADNYIKLRDSTLGNAIVLSGNDNVVVRIDVANDSVTDSFKVTRDVNIDLLTLFEYGELRITHSTFVPTLIALGDQNFSKLGAVAYGTGFFPIIDTLKFNGPTATPTAVLAADTIGEFRGTGWTGSGIGTGASMRWIADENWAVGSQGTGIEFHVVPNTTATLAAVWKITNAGVLHARNGPQDVGTATAAERVATLHVDDIHCYNDLEIDGDLNHDGTNVGFHGTAPVAKATVTGSRGGNAALASLLTALAARGDFTDSSTA